METRQIGSLTVSAVGLGCNNFGWRLDAAQSAEVVHAALDAGITFFDTADVYGGTRSEEHIGAAIQGRRDEVVLATKFGSKIDDTRSGARPAYIRRAVEDSLRRLNTDRIDLYHLHQPDVTVPIADTLATLADLVREGKVREIGCSNFSAGQLREAEAMVAPGSARFVTLQNEYSLLHRDPEGDVLPECERLGVSFLPYFPLASGLLTGKYRRGQPLPEGTRIADRGYRSDILTDQNLEVVEELVQFAEQRGHTLLELAFAWLLARPVVASVIAGATSSRQIQANVAAAGWRLTEAELAEVDAIAAQPA